MLEREYEFFKANKDRLRSDHPKRFWIIVGEEIVGEYESRAEAYDAAIRKYELGSFLLQDTSDEHQVQRFNSRVSF